MKLRIVAVLSACFLLIACNQTNKEAIYKISGQTMGTTYHISWVGQSPQASEMLKQKVDERLVAINKSMSTYDPTSELSLINQNKGPKDKLGWFLVSNDLKEVLGLSIDVWYDSQGAFDVTVGPLVNLWGFGPQARPEQVPEQSEIDKLLKNIGTDQLELDLSAPALYVATPQYIDLSAVAKGWAVDEVGKVLERQGIHSYLVEIGGEIAAKGKKPDDQSWRIAIEKPEQLLKKTAMLVIELDGVGVATSGDYRNYYEEEGVRYSHTIDPSTGYPITHNLASVTVVHPSTGAADAWATAITVAGPEKGLELAEKNNLMVYMQIGEGANFIERYSSAFKQAFPQVGGK